MTTTTAHAEEIDLDEFDGLLDFILVEEEAAAL